MDRKIFTDLSKFQSKFQHIINTELIVAGTGLHVIWGPNGSGKGTAVRYGLTHRKHNINFRIISDYKQFKYAETIMRNMIPSSSISTSLPTLFVDDLDQIKCSEKEKLSVMMSLAISSVNHGGCKAFVTISDPHLAEKVMKLNGTEKIDLIGWSKFKAEPLLMSWTPEQCWKLISTSASLNWTPLMKVSLLHECYESPVVTPGNLVRLLKKYRDADENLLKTVLMDFHEHEVNRDYWITSMTRIIDI